MGVVHQLLTRLIIGLVFASTGWGKLHNLQKIIDFFNSLGIPAAKIQAPFVAGMEFLCGVLVLIGLATRYASIPLIIIMLVAIRTAKWEEVTGVFSLFDMSEFLYMVLLTWLVVYGGGKISVDYLICKRCRRDK